VEPPEALAALEQIETDLDDVEHALRRLDDGSYAVCAKCGGPIADQRLEAMPATRLCRDDHR